MNIKKLFVRTSIGVGIVGIILVLVLLANSRAQLCETGHMNVTEGDKKFCYYINTTCSANEQAIPQPTLENQPQEYKCVYEASGFMNSKVFIYVLVFLGVGWLIIFIIFLVDAARKGDKTLELGAFRKEDFVHADRARKLWALTMARENGIPIYGEEGKEKYQESVFNWFAKQNVFQKGQEWFVRFQCEVTAGKNPGLYTVILSLSRGERWILEGMQNWEECYYDAYKMSRTMPLHTPENPQERLLQQMMESNPERAMELQQKMMEEGLQNPNAMKEQVAPDVIQQQPMMPPQRPRYPARRPWYGGRRY
jgi:hypothetical protein